MTALLQQRCWNHDAREAVCRCPECGRSYCRECVTEHESRLLCASCLKTPAVAAPARRTRVRGLSTAALALAGLLLSWMIFYGAGEAMLLLAARMEQTVTEPRP